MQVVHAVAGGQGVDARGAEGLQAPAQAGHPRPDVRRLVVGQDRPVSRVPARRDLEVAEEHVGGRVRPRRQVERHHALGVDQEPAGNLDLAAVLPADEATGRVVVLHPQRVTSPAPGEPSRARRKADAESPVRADDFPGPRRSELPLALHRRVEKRLEK